MPTTPDTGRLFECSTCWAVVEDGMLNSHLEWHEQVDTAIERLAQALAALQPELP